MPVRNGGPYLEAALSSILRQTFRDFEVLAIDDGSTDETPLILQRMAAGDPRLRTVRRTASGIVEALNFGLSIADCDYIARMDADDIAAPRRLEHQVRRLDGDRALVVCGTDYLVFGAERALGISTHSDRGCKARLLLFPCFLHSSTVLRRSTLERTGIRYRSDYPHCEDYRLWSDLAPHGEFGNLPRLLMRYRAHSGQVSAEHRQVQRRNHVKIAAENLRHAGIDGIEEAGLMEFLWPAEGERNRSSRAAYAHSSMHLLWRLVGGASKHRARLATMMLGRIARNLIERPV